jgi:hypothetical protein
MLGHNPLPKLDHGPSLLPNLDKEIADELTALHKQQFDSIQTAIFMRMSAKEIQEYDQRSVRIRAIL